MKGLDIAIEPLRLELEEKFQSLDASFVAFGRTFRNKRKDNLIPENYLGSKEYKEVLLNDNIAGHCFFYHDSDIDLNAGGMADTNFSIYFAVNLSKLYTDETAAGERATEYLHEDILLQINKVEFTTLKIATGYESFEKFKLSNYKDNLQPFYLCRFDLNGSYPIIEFQDCINF